MNTSAFGLYLIFSLRFFSSFVAFFHIHKNAIPTAFFFSRSHKRRSPTFSWIIYTATATIQLTYNSVFILLFIRISNRRSRNANRDSIFHHYSLIRFVLIEKHELRTNRKYNERERRTSYPFPNFKSQSYCNSFNEHLNTSAMRCARTTKKLCCWKWWDVAMRGRKWRFPCA